MNRRQFLRSTIPVSTMPFLLNGLPLNAYGRAPLLDSLTGSAVPTDRVLVLVQLGGGNDGINTIIPLDQYDAYTKARSNIAIPEPAALRLNDAAGFHPAMSGMHELYKQGRLSIVQGVSYPNPDLSHFRASDIWLTAAQSDEYLSTGWLGRYLQQEFAGYPEGYPNEVMPDPLAIEIGAVTSLAFQGTSGPTAISLQDPDTFHYLVNKSPQDPEESAPVTPAGRELSFIRRVATQSIQYADRVKLASDRANGVPRSSRYPSGGTNYLADQLKIVATLIAGGLKTRLYLVNQYGYDNHSSQVESGETTTGTHARLLGQLSEAVSAFQDDLRRLGIEDRVLGLTFSEFGRRVYSNSSLGTDHGTAAPLFLFGRAARGGIIGSNPDLEDLVHGNLKQQFDFRSVYASVLSHWFGGNQSVLDAVLMRPFETVPAVRQYYHIDESGSRIYPATIVLHNNYPNPFNPTTTISYELPDESNVVLEVFDMRGRRVARLVNGRQNAGRYDVRFTAAARLTSGTYIARLRSGSYTQTKPMLLIR